MSSPLSEAIAESELEIDVRGLLGGQVEEVVRRTDLPTFALRRSCFALRIVVLLESGLGGIDHSLGRLRRLLLKTSEMITASESVL